MPPPAVVLAGTATGLAAAVEIGRHAFLAAALLLQLKTLLDNADGQLARLSGRITAFGRYLDSESDMLVDAAIFAALGLWINPWLALTAMRPHRRALDQLQPRAPVPRGAQRRLRRIARRAHIYAIVYAPQDRLAEALVRRRPSRSTVGIVANFGLSTQLAALGVCLAVGHPRVYLVVLLVCTAVVTALVANDSRRSTT